MIRYTAAFWFRLKCCQAVFSPGTNLGPRMLLGLCQGLRELVNHDDECLSDFSDEVGNSKKPLVFQWPPSKSCKTQWSRTAMENPISLVTSLVIFITVALHCEGSEQGFRVACSLLENTCPINEPIRPSCVCVFGEVLIFRPFKSSQSKG